MRLKFNSKNKILKVSVYISLIIVFIYLFIYIMFHTDIKYLIIDSVNYNYDSRRLYLNNLSKSDYVYLSLNKITTFDSNAKLEEIEEEFKDVDLDTDIINEPLIYIYNTHQTEGYNYEKLDHTVKPTVQFASYILKDYLNDYSIESVVETSSIKKYLDEHNLQYNYSYEASRYYLKNIKDKYPSIEYFIDLHRDSSKINKTLYEKDKVRYARILFVVGMKHSNSASNLEFVTELNNMLNDKYKGISRGIYKREDARFNQDMSNRCILIELGGVDNTLEEINNSLGVVSKILSEYIGEHNGK